MTTYCDNKKDWSGKSEPQKLQAVKDIVNETLGDEGAKPVKFKVVKDLKRDDGTPVDGYYKNGVVSVDKDHLNNDGYEKIAETAFHESRHAVNDQNGWPDLSDLDGEPIGPGNYWIEDGIYISQKGSIYDLLGDAYVETDEDLNQLKEIEESDAQDYAEERLNKEKKKCNKNKSAESSSKNPLPKSGWNLPSAGSRVG